MELIPVYILVIVALIWSSLQFYEAIKYHTWKRAFRDAILDWELDGVDEFGHRRYRSFPYKTYLGLEKSLEEALLKSKR
ncbi:hypothetical protein LCGC14_2254980, partial [marine sediment metagenome]